MNHESRSLDYPEAVTHVSLCAGYAGIDLGLRRVIAALRTIAYCEIEAYPTANLVAKMEAGLLDAAPVWTNLKTFPWEQFRGKIRLLTGGYPCQPFSAAGQRLGTEDPRHLWPFILAGIRIALPDVCFFENVEGHISLGLRQVLLDLEEAGYWRTWGVFSAAEVGASHQRKRVFILAYRSSTGLERLCRDGRNSNKPRWLDPKSEGPVSPRSLSAWPSGPGSAQHWWEPSRTVADAPRLHGSSGSGELRGRRGICQTGQAVGHPESDEQRGLPIAPVHGKGLEIGRSGGTSLGHSSGGEWSNTERQGGLCLAGELVDKAGRIEGADSTDGSGQAMVDAESERPRTFGAEHAGVKRGYPIASASTESVDDTNGDRQFQHEAPASPLPSGHGPDNGLLGPTSQHAAEREMGDSAGSRFGGWENSGTGSGHAGADGRRSEQSERAGELVHAADEGFSERTSRPEGRSKPEQEFERPAGDSERETESPLGRDPDGDSSGVDYAELCVASDNRADELRMCGNGVVPATAERAYIVLISRALAKIGAQAHA